MPAAAVGALTPHRLAGGRPHLRRPADRSWDLLDRRWPKSVADRDNRLNGGSEPEGAAEVFLALGDRLEASPGLAGSRVRVRLQPEVEPAPIRRHADRARL